MGRLKMLGRAVRLSTEEAKGGEQDEVEDRAGVAG
jgi:hypothetical protein